MLKKYCAIFNINSWTTPSPPPSIWLTLQVNDIVRWENLQTRKTKSILSRARVLCTFRSVGRVGTICIIAAVKFFLHSARCDIGNFNAYCSLLISHEGLKCEKIDLMNQKVVSSWWMIYGRREENQSTSPLNRPHRSIWNVKKNRILLMTFCAFAIFTSITLMHVKLCVWKTTASHHLTLPAAASFRTSCIKLIT